MVYDTQIILQFAFPWIFFIFIHRETLSSFILTAMWYFIVCVHLSLPVFLLIDIYLFSPKFCITVILQWTLLYLMHMDESLSRV